MQVLRVYLVTRISFHFYYVCLEIFWGFLDPTKHLSTKRLEKITDKKVGLRYRLKILNKKRTKNLFLESGSYDLTIWTHKRNLKYPVLHSQLPHCNFAPTSSKWWNWFLTIPFIFGNKSTILQFIGKWISKNSFFFPLFNYVTLY